MILIPTHTPRFSFFRVIAAAATVRHFKCATNRPVIAVSACNERSDICPVPLLFPDKRSHSDARRNTPPPPPSPRSAFILHAKAANNQRGEKKVWHLLSDIYLAADYSTRGGCNNNQHAFNLKEKNVPFRITQAGRDIAFCVGVCVCGRSYNSCAGRLPQCNINANQKS